ncbi:MAG: CDP-alcohol phosphatidyltransferase family protein [Sphingobacteriaceae bacterium]|nr:CDP-alcohol phosphatidyltransferase family protein [Sphingobacteriaceae bacterium]
MRAAIPNAITLGNLLLGCIGLSFAAWGDFPAAGFCIYGAAVLDFFDGFAARLLKAYSVIGKDLDSLADAVSFGVLPAFILFQLSASLPGIPYTEYLVYAVALASVLRLARFNNDSRQTDGFIGLPTPANAMLIASLLIWLGGKGSSWMPLLEKWHITLFAAIVSYLLLSPIPMMAFKFKNFGWKENQERYLFLIFSLFLLLWHVYLGLAFVILAYVSWSVLRLLLPKRNS